MEQKGNHKLSICLYTGRSGIDAVSFQELEACGQLPQHPNNVQRLFAAAGFIVLQAGGWRTVVHPVGITEEDP